MPLPFLSWTLAPCFIGPWSIYNKSSHHTLMSFHQNAFRNFQPFVSNLVLQCIHHFWASHSLFIISSFFLGIAFQLEYIVAFLSKSMKFSSFWVQTYNKEIQDQGVHFGFEGCQMLSPQRICYLRAKVLFFKKAFSTWAYNQQLNYGLINLSS